MNTKSKMIDRLVQRYAGCEKLPEGPMRDNCEKKSEEGKKSDKEAAPQESEASFIKRVISLVGVHPSKIMRGDKFDLLGGHTVAQRGNTRVVYVGPPDKHEDGSETWPRSQARIVTL